MRKNVIGKSIVFEKRFEASGTFGALNEAQKFCSTLGIAVGSLCRDKPIGLLVGEADIDKWRNLTPEDVRQLDGVLIADDGNFRDGPVTLLLAVDPEGRKHGSC